jgi:tetratricopeptide (TPR) repeat protein
VTNPVQTLENLWLDLRFSRLFLQLPQELQEPPGVFLLALALLLLSALLLRWLWRLLVVGGISSASISSSAGRGEHKRLRQEIRACRRQGDLKGVGQRLEALGKTRAALTAYRSSGAFAEAADLLLRNGQRKEAKAMARQGEQWVLYAELAEEDGEYGEAAVANERVERPYAAARCYELAGLLEQAAQAYQEAGMGVRALELLSRLDGRDTAIALDAAIRSAVVSGGHQGLGTETAAAVRHCAQLWLEEEEPDRAFSLAVACEEWETAVPIARDFLPPSVESAEACLRAGAPLVAAEIFKELGDGRREALVRAELFEQQENTAEAAIWYEKAQEWAPAAEHWAAAGETMRAAELYAQAGDFRTAADLYADSGDLGRQREMLSRLPGMVPEQLANGGDATRVLERQQTAAAHPAPAEEHRAEANRYILHEEIGRGGMGVVYRAEDRLLTRSVAYKVLPDSLLRSAEASESLLAEARAAARLSHPNIVQVYDAGHREDGFFIVMELVEGPTFADLLAEQRFSVKGAIKVGRQICAALDHAHRRRLVHRDLKPSNLLWTEDKQVKLTDFGLARAFDGASDKIHTRPAGTPLYMAPEQLNGEAVDERTDIYALGCVLFEILCNRNPYEGRSLIVRLKSPPEDPRATRAEIPDELAELVLSCLQKAPEERPPSAASVSQALKRILSE